MRTVSRVGLLPVIGLLCWCVFGTLGLMGCGGSGGGGDRAAADTIRLTLQITTPGPTSQIASQRRALPAGLRQAIDPDVITRLRVEVSAADIPGPITAEVTNVTTDTVAVDLVVPMGSNRLVTVMAFNGFDVETFRGDLIVNLTQANQAVEIELTPQASTNPAVSGLISAATGGTLTVTDERTGLVGTTLVIPPRALASDTTLALGTTNNPDVLPALLSGLEGVGLVLAFSPSGTTFRIPAILTLPYDPAAVAALGLTERTLRFFVLEDGAQTWQEIPGVVVDTATHLITVPLSSFSQGRIAGGGNRPPQLAPLDLPDGRRGPDTYHIDHSHRPRWRRPDAHGQWPAGLCQLHGYRQWHGQHNPDAGL